MPAGVTGECPAGTARGLGHLTATASAPVQRGHGRGRPELGIATANFPPETSRDLIAKLGGTGIYYGLAMLAGQSQTYKMVASLGWNPFYRDPAPTFEVHLLDYDGSDFYGETLAVRVLGYLRPEENYPSLEHLVRAIQRDISIAREKLTSDAVTAAAEDLTAYSNKLAPRPG